MRTLHAAAFAAVASCTNGPTAPTAATIYDELVDAGCLIADDAGLPHVQAEIALGDAASAWMQCLEKAGGTVVTCGVPCNK
jgi:hypothetical protein